MKHNQSKKTYQRNYRKAYQKQRAKAECYADIITTMIWLIQGVLRSRLTKQDLQLEIQAIVSENEQKFYLQGENL